MKRHFRLTSRDPVHSWILSATPEASHKLASASPLQTFPSQTPATVSRSSSSSLWPKFPSCDPSSSMASNVPSPAQFLTSRTSSAFQTLILDSTSLPIQIKSSSAFPQISITSNASSKVPASFSSTSTATVLEIITTTSPSTPTNLSPSNTSLAPSSHLPNDHSSFFDRLSTDAKVGFLLGLILFTSFMIVLAVYLCRRKRRRARYPIANSQRPTSYAQETQHLTAPTPEPSGMAVRFIPAGVPRTSLDETGTRWPEKVVLKGEAKEVWEWSEQYGRGRQEEGCAGRVLESYGF